MAPVIRIRVGPADFVPAAETAALLAELPDGGGQVGAVVSFTGLVREVWPGQPRDVPALTLEHYPGMTEKSLTAICHEAAARWALAGVSVVHRVGPLRPTDAIVLVVVASAHRGDAFAACEFIMDQLKTRAPFWKQETTPEGPRWVAARACDDARARRWSDPVAGGD